MYAHTGDIPDVEVKPPAEVLFICKLNPVTTDADLGMYIICMILYILLHSCKRSVHTILYLCNVITSVIHLYIHTIHLHYSPTLYTYTIHLYIYIPHIYIHNIYTLYLYYTHIPCTIIYTYRANLLPLRSDQRMCNNKRQQNRYSKVIPPHYNSHNYDP